MGTSRSLRSRMSARWRSLAFVGVAAALALAVRGFEIPEVEWMSPSVGHVGGGEVVTLSGKKLASVKDVPGVELTCKFDTEYVRAYYIDDETVKCTAPAHTEGFVNVEFALNNETGDFLTTKGYQFVSGAKIDALYSIYGVSGGLVDVVGIDMHASQYCRFGELTTAAYIVSSGLMRCESPAIESGTVSVDVSLTASSFFEAFSSVQHVYIEQPSITRVSPMTGVSAGGTVVTVIGRNFAPTSLLRCRFGAIEVEAVWKSSSTLECTTPATDGALKGFGISMNHRDYTTFAAPLAFGSSFRADSIVPSQVSAAGSSHVLITVPGVVPGVFPELACKFGSHSVPGTAGVNVVSCIAPAAVGFVPVAVAVNGQDFRYSVAVPDSVQLELKDVVEITRIAPRVGTLGGGTLVHVEGEHLLHDHPVCRFGTVIATATRVSSRLLICETPPMLEGAYALDVSVVATAPELAMKPQFLFDPPPVVTALSPSMGLIEGGTTVTAAGHSFSDTHDLACKFGSIGPVVGEWIAEDEYRCVAPAHAGGSVEFDVGLVNEFDAMFADGPRVTFVYADEASITAIINNQNNTATVTGTGFVPGQEVYCNLGNGDALVPGVVMSDGSVLCGLPEDNNGVNEYDITIVDSKGNSLVTVTDANNILTRKVRVDYLSPTFGPIVGGIAVVVHGDHFSSSSLCRFGTLAPFPAIFISTAQVVCVAPTMEVGYHDLAVSNNAFDWSVPGLAFEFTNTSSSVLTRLSPKSGPIQGGTLLTFTGIALRKDAPLSFRIGTIVNVPGRWLAVNRATCISPAHATGSVEVAVRYHNSGSEIMLMDSNLDYEYTDMSHAQSQNSWVAMPESGFSSGGVSITLYGGGFYGSDRSCKFGDTAANALKVGDRTICNAPASNSGFTVIELSMNSHDFTVFDVDFQYVTKPKLERVTPQIVPSVGGSFVYMSGSNLVWGGSAYSIACIFTTGTTSRESFVHVISSSIIICVTPENKDGDVRLQLSYNEAEQTSSVEVRFQPLPEIDVSHPSLRGLHFGGGTVEIFGNFSTDLSITSCKVGTISGIPIALASSERVTCVLPAHSNETVGVTVTMNDRDHASRTLLYEYLGDIDVIEPRRSSVSLHGGSLVEFVLQPPVDTTLQIVCVFDLEPVRATEIRSDGAVSCLAPSHSPGFVAVALHVHDIGMPISSHMHVYYETHALMASLRPRDGSEGGGEIITLIGEHFSESMRDQLVFGHDKISHGQFVSSALFLIEQPPNAAGHVALSLLAPGSMSLIDDEFTSSVLLFEYFEAGNEPVYASPSEGEEQGGYVFTIFYKVSPGHQSFDSAACRFGTIGPVVGQLAGNGLECVVPARTSSDSVSVGARLFGEMFMRLPAAFIYRETFMVNTSSSIYPAYGSVKGGSLIHITHEMEIEGTLHCHIAGFYVLATNNVMRVPQSSQVPYMYVSECITPSYAPGFAQVTLGAVPGKDAAESLFLFLPDAVMISAYPTSIGNAGGDLITVTGDHFLEQVDPETGDGSVRCYFGDQSGTAKVHSSSYAACESPYLFNDRGQIALYVDNGGSYDEAMPLTIRYLPAPALVDISADSVAYSGGSVVTISTLEYPRRLEEILETPSVRIGTIGPVYARATGSTLEFVTPARNSTDSVPVWLSSHLSSSNTAVFVLTYSDDDVEVMTVVPVRASTEGLIQATLEVLAHKHTDPPKGCLFGVVPVIPATGDSVARHSQCSGSRVRSCVMFKITCTVPALPAGFVELKTIGTDAVGVDFEIFFPPIITGAMPSIGFVSGSTVVHVSGEHLHESTHCYFGLQKVTAIAVSSALSLCIAPTVNLEEEIPSVVSLGISSAESEDSFSELPGAFEFVNDFRMFPEPNTSLSVAGGDLVTFDVNIKTTEWPVLCRFGAIGPVVSINQGDSSIVCISPAGLKDKAVIGSLSYNSQEQIFMRNFMYVSPLNVSAVIPSRSISYGGASVRFMADRLDSLPLTSRVGCKIDGTMTKARLENDRTGLCQTPPAEFGFSVITLVVASDTSAAVEFEIFMKPVVFNVQPVQGPASGTTVLHFSGDSLQEVGSCYFGAEKSEAHVVSSALGICVTPACHDCKVPMNTSKVVIEMSLRDDDAFMDSTLMDNTLLDISEYVQSTFLEYGTDFEYVNDLSISALSPSTGSEHGGTSLSLAVNKLQDGVRYSCKFGTFFPITAYVTQSNVLTCVTPAMRTSDNVSVSISPNMRDVSSDNPVEFIYLVPATISGIVPKVGLSGSRSPVFIMGSNFVNSTSMVCRFGKELVKATYLSEKSILCVAGMEQTGTRTVFVEVSTNGVDFSDSRLLFHFSPCPSGSYCPGNEPVLCPRGAYCDGGRNFTLCPSGTFQPRTGQSNCLPAPIGFIAPDAGAFVPVVCPRGFVCDSTGLAIPGKLCPPGHYCLEGTRTSNFTDFSVAERPLPCPFGMYCTAGVVSSASIAHNFSTPQQCYAGYVCEPGSITPQGTGPCPPGHYCPPGQRLPCPNRGVYCPGVANTEPKPCLPGEYNSDYGRETCKKCPKGTICPGFARSEPEPCTPGFVCDTEGLAVAGTRCPAGHYCLANTVTRDPLAIIDEDSILAAAQPLILNRTNLRPKPCPPRTFCTEGVTTDQILEGSFKQPQPCKEGSFCEWATGDSTVVSDSATDVYNPMRPCPSGHYCPKRTYIPIPSPRGSYSSGEGNTAAVTCLPGKYTPYEGFQECLQCPAGYECIDEGTFKPTACQPGYFRSARDPIACRQCPKGTWSPAIALTEEAMCIPCNPGLVCAIDGMSNNKPRGTGTLATNLYSAYCDADNTAVYDPSKCVLTHLDTEGQAELCPEGYVCDARTSIAQNKCPDGYYCGYGTTPETQFANKCPAGYYCPAGSAYTTRQQFPCQACFFCEAGTGQVLERCPNGTSSSPLARSNDECLADLITFWRIMPVSFDLIEKVFEKMTNATDVPAAAREAAKAGFDARRRNLLQVTADNATMPDPNATDPFNYMGIGGCQNKNWELLNPSFILSDNNVNVTVDEENIPLVMFTLPRGHSAKVRIDWRNISEELEYGDHYELLIFTDPALQQTTCPESEFKDVPCPPWDVGDGVTWLNMREIESEKQEKKCPASQEALEMPFWFSRNSDGTATGYNVENPEWGTYVWKRGMHELSLHAADDLPFRIEVRMLHGRYQANNRASFLNTICIDVEFPHRANEEFPTYSFHAILPGDIDEDFQGPLNAPVASSFMRSVPNDYFNCANINQDTGCRRIDPRVTIDYNSTYGAEWKKFKYLRCGENGNCDNNTVLSADISPSQADFNLTTLQVEDWVIVADDGQTDETVTLSLPDVYEQEKYLLNEGLWTSGAALFAMDYLPFFSACRGFDSHIYLADVTETPWTPVKFGDGTDERTFVSYGEASLVGTEDVVFINPYQPQVQIPVADEVSITAQCFYEEAFAEPSAKKRWYEADGDVLFYLTAEAESQDALFEASILANDQTEPPASTSKYENDIENQLNIPVAFSPADGVVLSAGLIPTTMDFDIFYFQVTPTEKRIVTATVTMDEYVSAKTHDGTYTLNINVAAYSWFDLVNAFAFDFFFYFILFVAIGVLAVAIIVAVLIQVRIFTLVKDPPKIRIVEYLRLVVMPPLFGVSLGMAPFMASQFAFQAAFTAFPILVEFPISIDDYGREGDPALLAMIPKATTGRYGVCFLTASMYIMGCAAEILIPAELKDEEEKELEDERYVDEVMFKPEVWKRSHFVLLNLLVNVTNVLVIEFSFTNTFGNQFFTIFFILKVFHILLEMQVETALGEAFLLAPVSLVLSASVGLATIGADDFTDFTLGFFFETLMGMVEYVYLDAFVAWCAIVVPGYVGRFVDRILAILPFRFGDEDDIEEEAEIEVEDTLVEDMMGFLAAYGGNAASLWMTPPFIFFFWQYNDSLRLSHQYGFKKNDLLIYFLFSVVIIPFQIIMDVLTFNIQELFHGWKVYEYLKYARYRFINRTARWKGLERVYDESIDPGLRAIDQMCFSSQFYFVLALGGSGSFLFVLAISMMLRFQYNMFEDILFFPLVLLVLGASYMGKRIALILADRTGLWKITSAITSGEMLVEENPDEDFNMIFVPRGLTVVPARRGDEPRGDSLDVTSAEITSDAFRHLFMSKNREWVIDQLEEILTPRTAKRLKLGRAARRKANAEAMSDTDTDLEDGYGRVRLSENADRAMRIWLAHAASRASNRGANLLMLSDTSESENEAGLQRFSPVTLSEGGSAALTGWLAAVKQLRANRQSSLRNVAFSSTDFSSESDTDAEMKYTPAKNIDERSKSAVRIWLRCVREARSQMPPPIPEELLSDDSGESSSLVSSDSNQSERRTVSSVAASAASVWLSAARAVQVSRPTPAAKLTVSTRRREEFFSSDSDSSDLESPNDPELTFDETQSSRPSTTSAGVLRGWLTSARGVFASRTQREPAGADDAGGTDTDAKRSDLSE